jgi:hypothetical protein
MTNEESTGLPGDLGEIINNCRKERKVIMYRTTVHSKEIPRSEADEVTKDFKEFLAKKYWMDAKANDLTAALLIGTFHWYDAKPVFPDLKPEDLPKQSNLKILEIRRYDSAANKDNRAIFVLSTNQTEIEKAIEGIASFYTEKGYELHQSWGGLKDRERAGPDTKF